MRKQIKFNSLNDIYFLQNQIVNLDDEAALSSKDDSMMVDAKTFLGLWSLNFNEPIYLISEDDKLFKKVSHLLVN